jgi:hypothetical protein
METVLHKQLKFLHVGVVCDQFSILSFGSNKCLERRLNKWVDRHEWKRKVHINGDSTQTFLKFILF